MTILEQILATKREEVESRKKQLSAGQLLETALAGRKRLSMRQALENSPYGIIAEFKRKSPSKGFIHRDADVAEVVSGYAANGAAACSVLTDSLYFGGSPDDLKHAREAVNIPLLRKDFVIDPYQLAEAAAWGADVVLLIAAALTPEQCSELAGAAHELGLEVLLEVHRQEELDRICPGVDIVGINNRNLATFATDIYTSFELAKQIPAPYLKISESGIHSIDTVKALREAGFRGFLIGERFMQEAHPGEALKKFIGHAD